MARLDNLCSDSLNLTIKIRKGQHKKIFCGPSKIFNGPLIYALNVSWPLQKPSDPPSLPTHLYVPSLITIHMSNLDGKSIFRPTGLIYQPCIKQGKFPTD